MTNKTSTEPQVMPETKYPNELEVGEYFSYPGLFKVYQVQSKPEIDPAFSSTRVMCHFCNNPHQPIARYIFEVGDGTDRDLMGIRLRANIICTIHDSFEG